MKFPCSFNRYPASCVFAQESTSRYFNFIENLQMQPGPMQKYTTANLKISFTGICQKLKDSMTHLFCGWGQQKTYQSGWSKKSSSSQLCLYCLGTLTCHSIKCERMRENGKCNNVECPSPPNHPTSPHQIKQDHSHWPKTLEAK